MDSVKEIFTEKPLLDLSFEVLVRCNDQPDVHVNGVSPPTG